MIDGDRAVLRFDDGLTLGMIRVDGAWKLSVSDIIRSYGGRAQRAVEQLNRRRVFAYDLSRDIAAGRVRTPDDAVARIEREEHTVTDPGPAN